jgi:hypothetical protein
MILTLLIRSGSYGKSKVLGPTREGVVARLKLEAATGSTIASSFGENGRQGPQTGKLLIFQAPENYPGGVVF